MAYSVEVSPAAVRQWKKLTAEVQRRLTPVVSALADEPRPHGCEKLADADAYRVRVGDYRIVYGIDDESRVATLTKIAKRDEVYR